MRGKRQASAPAPGEPARNVRIAVTESHHGERMIYKDAQFYEAEYIFGSTSNTCPFYNILLPTCNAMSACPSPLFLLERFFPAQKLNSWLSRDVVQ